MASEDKWTIDKLNGSNWTTWKFQMKHLLLGRELWSVVDGSETLADGAGAEAQSSFDKKCQKALSTLVLSISSSQLYLITSFDKPKDAWSALCSHFERNTLANKLFLKKRFFRMEMKEGTSVEKHLKSMKELSDQLATLGSVITEEDQVVTLLGSLPDSFSTLVTALEARVDEGLTLKYVQQSLVNEEQKMRERSRTDVKRNDSALVGEHTKKLKHKKVICYGCQKPGHIRRDCPTLK